MGGVHLNRMGCPSWTESKGAFINTFGTPDSTCIPEDLLSADLILLWGVDLDAWPPQLSDYLVGARARGASVLLIHPAQPERSVRPLSLKRVFHHPKTATLSDRHIALRPDSHLAVVDALTQQWVQHSRVAEHFVTDVNGWDAFKASLQTFHPRHAADAAGVSPRLWHPASRPQTLRPMDFDTW